MVTCIASFHMPSLDEILAQGSESFRRLNRGAAGAIPADRAPAASTGSAVAPALPVPKSKPDRSETLDHQPPAQSGCALSAPPRPRVHFTLYRVRLLDTDNKWSAVKFLLDSIRRSGLLPDDRECDIDLRVTQQRVPHYSAEGTGVIISYPPT